ncbi:hypothetical protein LINGRAHAP2_LOCUS4638 [Linum grandiflorum]
MYNREQPLPAPSNHENQRQDVVAEPPLGASRCLTSDVWSHFTRLYVHGVLKAKCNYCKTVLGGKSTNCTSHLMTHRNQCVKKKIHDDSQIILGPYYNAKGTAEMSTNQLNNEVSRFGQSMILGQILSIKIYIHQ